MNSKLCALLFDQRSLLSLKCTSIYSSFVTPMNLLLQAIAKSNSLLSATPVFWGFPILCVPKADDPSGGVH